MTYSRSCCALVWHFQPRVVILQCPTHYRASSVNCLQKTLQENVQTTVKQQSIARLGELLRRPCSEYGSRQQWLKFKVQKDTEINKSVLFPRPYEGISNAAIHLAAVYLSVCPSVPCLSLSVIAVSHARYILSSTEKYSRFSALKTFYCFFVRKIVTSTVLIFSFERTKQLSFSSGIRTARLNTFAIIASPAPCGVLRFVALHRVIRVSFLSGLVCCRPRKNVGFKNNM